MIDKASVLFEKISRLLIGPYIQIISTAMQIISDKFGLEIKFAWDEKPQSVDQRLQKLEFAKSALAESLAAIDELQIEAKKSKEENDRVKAALEINMASNNDATKELEKLRKLKESDIEALRTVVGIGSIQKERFIGFVSGIVASVIASFLWTVGQAIFKKMGWTS